MSITSRMNFFTGFFTTARDWNEGQDYHVLKRRLHNRRLHTPGIVAGEGSDLGVIATGDLTLTVMPGAAVDGEGNEIYLAEPRILAINPVLFALPQTVYVRAVYDERPAQYVQNMETPQYSGHTRISEDPRIELTVERPDNHSAIELARIHLQEGVVRVSDPTDPLSPGGNEIDRRFVVFAGAVGLVPDRMPSVMRERIIHLMMRIRKDFASLDMRFPVPSAADVRHGAMTVEMLARTDGIPQASLSGILASLGSVELDLAQDIEARYPPVSRLIEYDVYQQRVAALLYAIQEGLDPDTLLTREDEVGMAARELAEAVLQLPEADAGPDFTVTGPGDERVAAIDAGNSRAYGGRAIVRYHWRFADIHSLPQADSGLDNTVFTTTEDQAVVLDAGRSRAYGGKGIVRYHWSVRRDG